jgi:plastocyanin
MVVARVTAMLLAGAALAGCGGTEPAAQARGGRVAIVLDDFLIRPQNVRAHAGRITFEITNRGRLGHNFRLLTDTGERLRVKTLLPGDSRTRSAVLAPGDYKMACTVANHAELGMTGTLVVR